MNSLSHITAADGPAGREDEAAAAASGYRGARARQGRTEPEKEEQTGRLPGGRGSWPRRPLGREKESSFAAAGPSRAGSAWPRSSRIAYTSGSLPTRTLPQLPLPLPLGGAPRPGPRPERPAAVSPACAGAVARLPGERVAGGVGWTGRREKRTGGLARAQREWRRVGLEMGSRFRTPPVKKPFFFFFKQPCAASCSPSTSVQ